MIEKSEDLLQKYKDFFKQNNWNFKENNFDPWDPTEVIYDIQVGYKAQQKQIEKYLCAGTGLLMLTGTPGWGKTNIARHIAKAREDKGDITVYFDVPPPTERDFVEHIAFALNQKGVLRKPLSYLFKPFENYATTLGIYNLKRKMANVKGKTIILVCDEAHSGDPKTNLNWFKAINDDKSINSKIVFIGYESERISLKETMERTFTDRTFEEVRLQGLNRDEIEGLIKQRLKYKCGEQSEIKIFNDVLDHVKLKSGGRPRFVLKVMSRLWRTMAEYGIKTADLTDLKPVIEAVEGEEKKMDSRAIPLTTFASPESFNPPNFSILPDFMHKLCKTIAEFPGQSTEELAVRLKTKKSIIWTNLARLNLKDKSYRGKLIKANITEPVIISRKEKVGNNKLKVYFLSEKYKGEFVK